MLKSSNDITTTWCQSSKSRFVIRAGWIYRNTPLNYFFILEFHWSTSEQLVHNSYGLERSNCSVPGTTLKGTNLNLLLGRLGFRICITRSQPSALTDLQDISVGPVISTSLNLWVKRPNQDKQGYMHTQDLDRAAYGHLVTCIEYLEATVLGLVLMHVWSSPMWSHHINHLYLNVTTSLTRIKVSAF